MKTAGAAILVVLASACARGQRDVAAVLADAQQAMGTRSLTSIAYSAVASEFGVGQSERADGPWPRIFDMNVTYATDFSKPRTHATLELLPTSPLGVPASPETGAAGSTAQSARVDVVIDAATPWMQQLDLWMSPWGFLRGAIANDATVASQHVDGRNYDVVSWESPQKSPSGVAYRLDGYLNERKLVDRVQTRVEDPFFGDMLVEAVFSEYRDVDGVKVPTRITHRHGGWPRVETTVVSATPNPKNIAELIQVPRVPGPMGANGAIFQPPPTHSEKVAPGVYRITGGYVAVAVEFADHIVVIEGPEGDARAQAIMAEARKVIPGKPITYVVNTHHHFDHASGLPAFAAEGVTIVTHENNRALFDRAFNGPRTLGQDRLGRSRRKARFETVRDVRVLKDATRVLELHHIEGLAHADGMLIAYLPREKIIVQADMAFIGPFQPLGERRTRVLLENLDRLKLDYDGVVFVHAPEPDRPVTRSDLIRIAAAEN